MAERRKWLLNAFKPSSVIYDPHAFVGREEQLRKITDDLRTRGRFTVICGDRGLGKTCLAVQASNIAQGDVILLRRMGAPHLAFPQGDRFITFAVNCTDALRTKDDVLQRLLNEMVAFRDGERPEHLDTTKRILEHKVLFKFYERKWVTEYVNPDGRTFASLDTEEQFQVTAEQLLQALKGKFSGLLFIVDELDRLENKAGLASFLKDISRNEFFKFILVGIARNSFELFESHQSVRHLHDVRVKEMSDADVDEIISTAERHLRRKRITISFNDAARNWIKSGAHGKPWYVHLVGQEALKIAYDSRQR